MSFLHGRDRVGQGPTAPAAGTQLAPHGRDLRLWSASRHDRGPMYAILYARLMSSAIWPDLAGSGRVADDVFAEPCDEWVRRALPDRARGSRHVAFSTF
ncbi:MAG TPA: hypothetical protein VIR00_15205 [Micromonosporaceae bacterium]